MVPGLLLALVAGTAGAQATIPPPPAAPTRAAAPASTAEDGTLSLDPSMEVQRVTHWIREAGDNGGMPYLVIDKTNAIAYAYTRAGRLQAYAPVLLGMTKGDRLLAPNSATMEVMGEDQRITPAGRFVARLAIDSNGVELLVLDYDASISLHAVVKGKPYEHRAERLASLTSDDNRISFGCINAPILFYNEVVSPAFKGTRGVVYVLPESGPAAQLFGFHAFDAPVPAASTAAVDAPDQGGAPASVAN